MAPLPSTAIDLDDFTKFWIDAVPPLRDQGEADLINRFLATLLDRMQRSGKTVPRMIYVSDAPPNDERARLLDTNGKIDTIWFQRSYARWAKSELFGKFWATLSETDQRKYFVEIPNE